MKKHMVLLVLLMMGAVAMAGVVGLPTERLAMPVVQGDHLVVVWDDAAGTWLGDFVSYDHSGVYEFQVPEWGKWYWIGLWDEDAGEYVYGKWIGHFKVD